MERYESLSVWRVTSCAAVFISHVSARAELQGSIRVITDFGYNRVLLFFIITGYLAAGGVFVLLCRRNSFMALFSRE